jgi:hypothetical protein
MRSFYVGCRLAFILPDIAFAKIDRCVITYIHVGSIFSHFVGSMLFRSSTLSGQVWLTTTRRRFKLVMWVLHIMLMLQACRYVNKSLQFWLLCLHSRLQTYLPFNTLSSWAWHNDSLPANGYKSRSPSSKINDWGIWSENPSEYRGVMRETCGREVFKVGPGATGIRAPRVRAR